MDFISHPIPAVIVLLGILVFVHEFGHFIVGRLCGIAVEIFSIGFGPPILSFKRGITHYRLSAIPLGGYVKFYGALPTEPVPPEVNGQEFFRASTFRRFLTIAAGPFANFLLAVVAYIALAKIGIPYVLPEIGYVNADGPAAQAGIRPGDRIMAIDGRDVANWRDLESIISKSPGRTLVFDVKRNAESLRLTVTPAKELGITEDGEGDVGRIGIAAATVAPSIAVVSKDSLAFASGLRSGDLVEKIEWVDSAGVNQVREIRSWHEMEITILEAAASSAGKSALLTVRSQRFGEAVNEDRSPTLEQPRSLNIELDDIALLDRENIALGLRKLGVVDGQTTINAPDRSVTDVLRPGDVITAINDRVINSQFDVYKYLDTVKEPTAEFTLIRDSEQFKTAVALKKYKKDLPDRVEDGFTLPAQMVAALRPPETLLERRSALESFEFGVRETLNQSLFLVRVLGKMFTGNISLGTMGGPILIAKVAGDAAKRGLQTFVSTLALISINLAVVNLVPIPVLDGGQIVLILAETVRRRPVSVAVIESYQRLGFVMVMALVVLVFYNDLNRFWSRMLEGVVGAGQ